MLLPRYPGVPGLVEYDVGSQEPLRAKRHSLNQNWSVWWSAYPYI